MNSNNYSRNDRASLLEDPRVWVLLLAAAMFFFAIIFDKEDSRNRRTVVIPFAVEATKSLTDGNSE